jgi:hypothetical protein
MRFHLPLFTLSPQSSFPSIYTCLHSFRDPSPIPHPFSIPCSLFDGFSTFYALLPSLTTLLNVFLFTVNRSESLVTSLNFCTRLRDPANSCTRCSTPCAFFHSFNSLLSLTVCLDVFSFTVDYSQSPDRLAEHLHSLWRPMATLCQSISTHFYLSSFPITFNHS